MHFIYVQYGCEKQSHVFYNLNHDIMGKYGISHASLYESIWMVVEAVNSCDEFSIEYQASETAQLKIAHEFENVSEVKFNNFAVAIDGILIWILKHIMPRMIHLLDQCYQG